jgi:Raf kinase inhibitor-like YbhB/YbcL family protein
MPLLLISPALAPSGPIPAQYTCDGGDISPPLRWSGVPAQAQSLVLVVEDPDTPRGVFRHWVAYDIAPGTPGIAAGYRADQPAPFKQAGNDFGKIGYGGPCPPAGDGPHHYHFELMALSQPSLAVPASADAASVITAAAPYVIERAEFVATYER